jgi:hypothetical protein
VSNHNITLGGESGVALHLSPEIRWTWFLLGVGALIVPRSRSHDWLEGAKQIADEDTEVTTEPAAVAKEVVA